MNLDLIKKHEGFKLWPYLDSLGISTVWYGHNLKANSICDEAKALMMQAADTQLAHDAQEALAYIQTLPYWTSLNPARQEVLLDLAYNLGSTRLAEFHHFHQAMQEGRYSDAKNELLDSLWAKQVGIRATQDSQIIESGIVEPS